MTVNDSKIISVTTKFDRNLAADVFILNDLLFPSQLLLRYLLFLLHFISCG